MSTTPETHEEANASTLREIQRVVARGESLQAEFKRTTGQRTDAAKTICGMLNASGGFVVFGGCDADSADSVCIQASKRHFTRRDAEKWRTRRTRSSFFLRVLRALRVRQAVELRVHSERWEAV